MSSSVDAHLLRRSHGKQQQHKSKPYMLISGLAHLLEHIIFTGSELFPAEGFSTFLRLNFIYMQQVCMQERVSFCGARDFFAASLTCNQL